MKLIEAMARAICAAESIDPDMEVYCEYPNPVPDYLMPTFVVDGHKYRRTPAPESIVPAWTTFQEHAKGAAEALKKATFEDHK